MTPAEVLKGSYIEQDQDHRYNHEVRFFDSEDVEEYCLTRVVHPV